MLQGSYTPESWKNQLSNPKSRVKQVRAMAKDSEVEIKEFWYAFGESDFFILCDATNNQAMASFAIAAATRQSVSDVTTTVLMSADEGLSAIHGAATITSQASWIDNQ
jgi:uncharacterized protein with GYD domain